MKSNSLLEEKWATQTRLAKEAHYDIKIMMQNCQKLLEQAERQYGIKFIVAKRKPMNTKRETKIKKETKKTKKMA